MNKNKDITKDVEALHEASQLVAEQYTAPDIETIDIELEQNIFAGSGDLPGMPGEGW